MDANLHDYTESNPPELLLTTPLFHPTNQMKVIGHTGLDKARSLKVAAFPRRHDEHWFRGISTSGLTGYGISESILNHLDRPNVDSIDRVFIIETDRDRVIEYELSRFEDATVVAYAPDLNESVIGDETMRVDDDIYTDRQRVLPIDAARQTFDRTDVTISQ